MGLRMDLSNASIVICLTLLVVIAINLLIYFTLRRGIKIREIDLFRQISDRSRLPWKKEDEELEELAKLVEKLKKSTETKDNIDYK